MNNGASEATNVRRPTAKDSGQQSGIEKGEYIKGNSNISFFIFFF